MVSLKHHIPSPIVNLSTGCRHVLILARRIWTLKNVLGDLCSFEPWCISFSKLTILTFKVILVAQFTLLALLAVTMCLPSAVIQQFREWYFGSVVGSETDTWLKVATEVCSLCSCQTKGVSLWSTDFCEKVKAGLQRFLSIEGHWRS